MTRFDSPGKVAPSLAEKMKSELTATHCQVARSMARSEEVELSFARKSVVDASRGKDHGRKRTLRPERQATEGGRAARWNG